MWKKEDLYNDAKVDRKVIYDSFDNYDEGVFAYLEDNKLKIIISDESGCAGGYFEYSLERLKNDIAKYEKQLEHIHKAFENFKYVETITIDQNIGIIEKFFKEEKK